jgi:hypothetical protein
MNYNFLSLNSVWKFYSLAFYEVYKYIYTPVVEFYYFSLLDGLIPIWVIHLTKFRRWNPVSGA